jgi:uncharacterized protein
VKRDSIGRIEFAEVDDIPISLCHPDQSVVKGSLAIWIPYLGGNRKTCMRELRRLSSAGYLALSIDPLQHGDRKGPKKPSLRTRVFREFRANMWPILGVTTLETYRIIDWAIETYHLSEDVAVGGVSMGGDIAIALAGIDKRIRKVSAIASTPDWARPGMTDVMDSGKVVEQGTATPFGTWLYDHLNPMTNRNAFFRGLAMHLEVGEDDTHISPRWAIGFKDAIAMECPKAAEAIEINVNEGCTHLSLIQKQSVANRAVDFLIK